MNIHMIIQINHNLCCWLTSSNLFEEVRIYWQANTSVSPFFSLCKYGYGGSADQIQTK